MDIDLRKNSIISHNLIHFLAKKDKKWSLADVWRQWDKYVYTLAILIMYFNYGLVVSVFPLAMIDMKYMFNTSMSLINYVNTFNSIGYMIGSLGGFLYVYINRQLTFTVLCTLLAIFIAIMPFCTAIWQLYLCAALSQLGLGAFEGGNSMWVVEMWQQNSAPVLQFTKAIYGFGTIVAPIVAKPYLIGELEINNSTDLYTTLDNITRVMTKDELNDSVERRSKIIVPFIIAGVVTMAVPILWLVMFVVKRYEEPGTAAKKKMSQQLETSIELSKERMYFESAPVAKWTLITLIALAGSTFSGLLQIHFYYIVTYMQYLPIRLSVKKTADIMSMMSATFTGGKIVSAYIAIKVRPAIMMSYHLITMCAAVAVLYFGQESEIMLWVGNGLMGFGLSPIWPCLLSLAENCFGLSDKISAILSFVSSVCPIISPFICGPFIEKLPNVFILTEAIYLAGTIILFILMMLLIHRSRRAEEPYVVNM